MRKGLLVSNLSGLPDFRNRVDRFSAALSQKNEARVSLAAGIEHFKEQFMKDDLDSLLKTWKPEVPEPVAFKRHVWSRIERRRFAIGWPERFLAWFTRPQIASLAAALSVLGGAWIGSATATRNGQVAYLHAVNPYAQVPLK